jgi:hypothetical protein
VVEAVGARRLEVVRVVSEINRFTGADSEPPEPVTLDKRAVDVEKLIVDE